MPRAGELQSQFAGGIAEAKVAGSRQRKYPDLTIRTILDFVDRVEAR